MPPAPQATQRWLKLINLLQLTRVALVFAAVSNVWLMVFLAYSLEPADRRNPALNEHSQLLGLLLTALVAGGLHNYGIALNDLLDARHDRLFSPHRPIPAGKIGHTGAVIVSVISLLAAMGAVTFLGTTSIMLGLVIAGGILFYDAAGKFLPAVGILVLGLIRATNMLVPNPAMSFAWPVWLTMTHTIACWAIAWHIEGKRPKLRAGDWWVICGGWAVATLVMLQWMSWHEAPLLGQRPLGWVWPAAAVVVFASLGAWKLRHLDTTRWRRADGAAFLRLALLWTIVYDACWLLAAGLYWQAAVIAALLTLAYGSMRLMRLVAHLSDPAPAFRLGAR